MIAANGTPEPKALEAVKLLVEHGVDVNAFNANGQTALHNAARSRGQFDRQFVAEQGAKLDRRDKQGRTALDVALGVGGGGGRRGAAARGRGAQPNEQTASLLRQLMAKTGVGGQPLLLRATRNEPIDPRLPGRRRDRVVTSLVITASIEVQGAAAPQSAQPGGSVWSGVFSAQQASRGKSSYDGVCARCHGVQLTGGADGGPTLTGGTFLSHWSNDTLASLFVKIRDTMPQEYAGHDQRGRQG